MKTDSGGKRATQMERDREGKRDTDGEMKTKRETGRDREKQKETKADRNQGRENETDRQAQERVCRGAREDGQVRPAERG